jgi:hypothetical protein
MMPNAEIERLDPHGLGMISACGAPGALDADEMPLAMKVRSRLRISQGSPFWSRF